VFEKRELRRNLDPRRMGNRRLDCIMRSFRTIIPRKMDRKVRTRRREAESIFSFGRKAEERRPLGRPRHRWENNIKMDLNNQDVWARTEFI
jgi:hypothetical protein